jgi:hypothetical protein
MGQGLKGRRLKMRFYAGLFKEMAVKNIHNIRFKKPTPIDCARYIFMRVLALDQTSDYFL